MLLQFYCLNEILII